MKQKNGKKIFIVGAGEIGQNLAKQLGVSYIRFENNKPQIPIDESSDCIVIDKNKCRNLIKF